MDPFARLFCVKYDKSPIMDYYWMENEEFNEGQLENLRLSGSGFTNVIQGHHSQLTSEVQGDDFYSLGQKMKSKVKPEGETEYFPQYHESFPIPYPNLYGECNNFHAGRFMESE